jgi:hypothetical protein
VHLGHVSGVVDDAAKVFLAVVPAAADGYVFDDSDISAVRVMWLARGGSKIKGASDAGNTKQAKPRESTTAKLANNENWPRDPSHSKHGGAQNGQSHGAGIIRTSACVCTLSSTDMSKTQIPHAMQGRKATGEDGP